ncbi:Uncharacterised protein [Serratia rubidaea]|uniref:Uncharacterized protein n=1 Tax=Serratia rubidaea TaxID=61652 RepID=A0A447QJN4_SERRU|nr:Uncharacterised protein [Serratia rubidaea]
MGQLVDGVWQDVWYDTKSTGGRFKRSTSSFATGSPLTDSPANTATAALMQKKIATTCTYPSPARGRTAPC